MNSALVVSIPLILVLSLTLAGHLAGRWAEASHTTPVCGDEAMEQQTRAAMFVALDNAFTAHVVNLYAVWMQEGGQPHRARAGVDRAVGGYVHGYKSVEAWKLKRC